MKKIKKFKIKQNSNNEYSSYHYFIPKSEHIKFADARTLDTEIGDLRNQINELEEKTQYLIDKAPLIGFGTGENITLRGCADSNFRKFKIEGNSKQEIIEEVKGKEVTGEYITINDVELEDGRITVSGNNKQETRSGKNLYKASSIWYKNINGTNITVSDRTENSCVLTSNGRAFTAFGSGQPGGSSEYRTKVEPNTEYTLSINAELLNGTSGIGLYVFFDKDSSSEYFNFKNIDYSKKITFTTPADTNYIHFRIDIYNASTSYKISNIQIEKGSEATSYELYGAMPSPDYPSEIVTVGSNINLFDKDNVKKINAYFDSTIHSNSANRIFWLKIDKNQNYTISKVKGSVFAVAFTEELPETGVSIYKTKYNNTGEVITTNSGSYDYLVCYYWSTSDVLTEQQVIDSIKIEKGSTASPYSPYGQGCINEVICNKNYFDVTKEPDKTGQNAINGLGATSYTKLENGYRFLNRYNAIGFTFKNLKIDTQYTVSFYATISNYPSGTSNTAIQYGLNRYTGSKSKTKVYDNMGLGGGNQQERRSFTFTCKDEENIVAFGLYSANDLNGIIVDITDVQIEESSTPTDYIQHQSQTYTIPTQQPFRAVGDIKDTFIKKNNKWYEHHPIFRQILDGTENIRINDGRYEITSKKLKAQRDMNWNSVLLISNYFKGSSFNELKSKNNRITYHPYDLLIAIYSTDFSTTDEIKAFLLEKYNAGTPVYVDYVLAEPIDIECTEEQSAVLEKLHNVTIYMPITHLYSTDKVSPNITLKYNYVLPSPSPEVPSEVESCGNNINLFDKDTVTNTILGNNGEVINNDSWKTSDYIKVKPLDNYTFSWLSDSSYFQVMIGMYDSNKTFIQRLDLTTGGIYEKKFQTLENCRYIRISYSVKVSGVNVTRDKIKFEKGSIATPYSPYGQGSIEIEVCNKNLAKINEINWELTENNTIKNKAKNDATKLATISLKKGQTVKISIKLKSKPTVDTSLTASGMPGIGFIRIDKFELDKKNIITYTASEDVEIIYILWGNAKSETFEFQFCAEIDEATDYIPHESYTKVLSIQKEFVKIGDVEDTFVKVDGKWYEKHYSPKIVFDGTENWTYDSERYRFYITIPKPLVSSQAIRHALSSHFKNGNTETDNNAFNLGSKQIFFRNESITSTSDWKNWLAEQYNIGTPLTAYYVVETPELIECTEEQNTILDQIEKEAKTYKNITHIYSTDKISPIFKTIYKKDIDALIADSGV